MYLVSTFSISNCRPKKKLSRRAVGNVAVGAKFKTPVRLRAKHCSRRSIITAI